MNADVCTTSGTYTHIWKEGVSGDWNNASMWIPSTVPDATSLVWLPSYDVSYQVDALQTEQEVNIMSLKLGNLTSMASTGPSLSGGVKTTTTFCFMSGRVLGIIQSQQVFTGTQGALYLDGYIVSTQMRIATNLDVSPISSIRVSQLQVSANITCQACHNIPLPPSQGPDIRVGPDFGGSSSQMQVENCFIDMIVTLENYPSQLDVSGSVVFQRSVSVFCSTINDDSRMLLPTPDSVLEIKSYFKPSNFLLGRNSALFVNGELTGYKVKFSSPYSSSNITVTQSSSCQGSCEFNVAYLATPTFYADFVNITLQKGSQFLVSQLQFGSGLYILVAGQVSRFVGDIVQQNEQNSMTISFANLAPLLIEGSLRVRDITFELTADSVFSVPLIQFTKDVDITGTFYQWDIQLRAKDGAIFYLLSSYTSVNVPAMSPYSSSYPVVKLNNTMVAYSNPNFYLSFEGTYPSHVDCNTLRHLNFTVKLVSMAVSPSQSHFNISMVSNSVKAEIRCLDSSSSISCGETSGTVYTGNGGIARFNFASLRSCPGVSDIAVLVKAGSANQSLPLQFDIPGAFPFWVITPVAVIAAIIVVLSVVFIYARNRKRQYQSL